MAISGCNDCTATRPSSVVPRASVVFVFSQPRTSTAASQPTSGIITADFIALKQPVAVNRGTTFAGTSHIDWRAPRAGNVLDQLIKNRH